MTNAKTWTAVGGVFLVILSLVASVSLVALHARDPSARPIRALEQANREMSASMDKAARRVEQELGQAKQEAATAKAVSERLAKAKAAAAEQVDRGNRSLSSLQAQRETVARELENRQRTLASLAQGRPQVLGVAPIPRSPEEIAEGQKISQLSLQLEQLQSSIDQQQARQQQAGASIKNADPDLAKTQEQAARSKREAEVWADVLSQLTATTPALKAGSPPPARQESNVKRATGEERWVPVWTAVVAAVGAVIAACIGAGVAAWAITARRQELNRKDEEPRLARRN